VNYGSDITAASRYLPVTESFALPPDPRRVVMTKIHSTSDCPKCHKPMSLTPAKMGERKLKCVDCDGEDPMKSIETAKLLAGHLRAPN
jgi:hypothetical protein